MAQESDEHREWRDDFNERQSRFVRISALAEQLLLSRAELDARDCITRARDLVMQIETLCPSRDDEPPFSDDPEPATEPDAAPAVDPTAAFVMTPPAVQRTNPGFWPR